MRTRTGRRSSGWASRRWTPSTGEAVGITRAARAAGVPVAISFTVETDGRLPSGQALGDAVAEVDTATGDGPDYYMINCAHPTHFDDVLPGDAAWTHRIVGLRANASTRSHAELDEAEELDGGDPHDLGARYRALRDRLPRLAVVGGAAAPTTGTSARSAPPGRSPARLRASTCRAARA